jgi:hypothetical protein
MKASLFGRRLCVAEAAWPCPLVVDVLLRTLGSRTRLADSC